MLSASSVADGGWGAVGVGGAVGSAVGGAALRWAARSVWWAARRASSGAVGLAGYIGGAGARPCAALLGRGLTIFFVLPYIFSC
jgi:hypothetical protein